LGIVLAVVFVMATGGLSQVTPATSTSKKIKPHWSKDACASCHTMVNGKVQPIALNAIDQKCLSCHDGQSASAEMHPIGHLQNKEDYDLPQGWPLVEGRLGCITCHDVRQGCDAAVAAPSFNTAFLRRPRTAAGDDREWVVTTDFCNGCHRADRAGKFNPHVMLVAGSSGNQIVEQRCLFCHQNVPNPQAMQRTGRSDLRGDQVVLCKSCHHTHKEIFKGGHVGTKLPPERLAYMRAREIVGLLDSPSADLVNQLKADNQQPTRLVPAADGTIICSTCHNPHEQGVFNPESVLAYRAMRATGNRTISPVHNPTFCRHCHSL